MMHFSQFFSFFFAFPTKQRSKEKFQFPSAFYVRLFVSFPTSQTQHILNMPIVLLHRIFSLFFFVYLLFCHRIRKARSKLIFFNSITINKFVQKLFQFFFSFCLFWSNLFLLSSWQITEGTFT